MSKKTFVIAFFLIIFSLFTSVWFLQLSFVVKTIIVFCSLTLLFKSPTYRVISLILLLILSIFEISTTRIKTAYEFSGWENYQQELRLSSYPTKLNLLGQILEKNVESPQILHFRQNFFDSLDFLDYFKNRFVLFLFIPFIVGLYHFIQQPDLYFVGLFSSILILLTFIGPKGDFGPFVLIPLIVNLIAYAVVKK